MVAMGAAPSSRSFVGRGRELERLDGALSAAAVGRGSAVLIAGEAGIGKTRVVSEVAARARAIGATVLVGRCVDLVGATLPYLPFAEALRPLSDPPWAERPTATEGEQEAQLRLFEDVLAALERGAAEGPLVLVLEDLHWADASTLELVAFLEHAVAEIGVVVIGTYRSDEPRPHHKLSADEEVIELGPLTLDELGTLLETAAGEELPAELTSAIHARSEGNPFFAQELLSATARGDARLPHLVRDALLRRVARLDATARTVLRIAAAAGHDAAYGLLSAAAGLPKAHLQKALRAAVEEDVLIADRATSSFRFRHALLAEAVYATLLPGEREDVHARLATALAAEPALGGTRSAAAELAHHWTVAGRWPEALAASVAAARDAEEVSGLAEALGHLEHVLDLWERVPDAPVRAGLSLDAVLARAAELSDLTGNAPRAAQLVRRAIEAIADADVTRAGLLYERLGSYLLVQGQREAGIAAFRRAADLVPGRPPSPERVRVLAALGNALIFDRRYAESLHVCEEAIAAADAVGDERPALRARTVAGYDLCYLGHVDAGIERLLDARRRIEAHGTARELTHVHLQLCDVLIATGRMRDAARVGLEGIDVARRLGLERSHGIGLAINAATAFVAIGDWDRAEEVLARATRLGGAFWPHHVEMLRAELELARGELEHARRHLDAAAPGATRPFAAAKYAGLAAELALWEGRVDDAARAVDDGIELASPDEQPRLYALALRTEAERAQFAADRRDRAAADTARARAAKLLDAARLAATAAARVSPEATAWRRVAEAEHARMDHSRPEAWREAAEAFDALDRPYVSAYCRWREAEAHVAAGAARSIATAPARAAHEVTRRLRARLLQRQLELLAQRARMYLVEPEQSERAEALSLLASGLGLTAREAEVLELVARGYTNREIAESLYISVKTASVHVTHILRKLGISSRVEAAAAAHRVVRPTVR
jgi:DNA-binding NarL/FixJ family response regulator/tetratricopeptide (TPR) repeat protein